MSNVTEACSCEYCGSPLDEDKRFCNDTCYQGWNNQDAESRHKIYVPIGSGRWNVAVRGEIYWGIFRMRSRLWGENESIDWEQLIGWILAIGADMWAGHVGIDPGRHEENFPGEASHDGPDADYIIPILDRLSTLWGPFRDNSQYSFDRPAMIRLLLATGIRRLEERYQVRPVKRSFEYRRNPILDADKVVRRHAEQQRSQEEGRQVDVARARELDEAGWSIPDICDDIDARPFDVMEALGLR